MVFFRSENSSHAVFFEKHLLSAPFSLHCAFFPCHDHTAFPIRRLFPHHFLCSVCHFFASGIFRTVFTSDIFARLRVSCFSRERGTDGHTGERKNDLISEVVFPYTGSVLMKKYVRLSEKTGEKKNPAYRRSSHENTTAAFFRFFSPCVTCPLRSENILLQRRSGRAESGIPARKGSRVPFFLPVGKQISAGRSKVPDICARGRGLLC